MVWGAAAVFSLVILSAPTQIHADSIPNSTCLACHSSMAKDSTALKGLYNVPGGGREKMSLQVTKDSLKGSIHEGFSCVDCHQDITSIPHPAKLKPVNCGNCHITEAEELTKSIHDKIGKAAPYTPMCINCHGAHQIMPKSNPKSTIYPANLPYTCGSCHSKTEMMRQLGVQIPNPLANYMKSEHWRALKTGKTMKAATCTDCHGSHLILPSTNPESTVYKKNTPATCGKCHPVIEKQYEASIHGQALAAGHMQAPACTDCHGEHDIEGPNQPTSRVSPVNVRLTCAQCHGQVRLARRFSLPSGMVQSYQASYHGLASQYGDTQVANCASCHTAHDILPASDPKSSINPKNLQKTCGKCHPNATAAFAHTPIHLKISETNSPVLYWLKWFYVILIVVVVGALGFHNFLDYLKGYREALKTLKPVAIYRRMTLPERIQHFLLLSSFFLLVITGFALKFPHSFWSWPFKFFPAGFEWRGLIHRIAAVVMMGTAGYHLVYLVGTKRGRRFLKDMMPTWQDVKDVREQLGYYFGLRRHGARFGRFSYVEKMEYLALIWGTIIMIATGLILWAKNWSTGFLPSWGWPAAEIIHFYEAVLAFTTIIIWHLYTVFSHTDKPPYNPTWLTGGMTKESLEHHHPKALEDIEKEKRREEEGWEPRD
jgi:cytochrome b subunit of formate dehydrogenase